MKRISYIMLIALAAMTAACSNSNADMKGRKDLIDPSKIVHNPRSINGISKEEAANLPVLTFADTMHDFGAMTEGEMVSYDFAFRNTGKTPLLIENAEGSCGCTVADYPREPIGPGGNAVMKVIFNSAGKHGHQEKDVAINANTQRGVYHLHINAEVNPKSD